MPAVDYSACALCGQVHDRAERCPVSPLRVLDDTELDSLPPAVWDIGNVSQRGTLEVLYGPTGAGKTTLMAERACCKATGLDWFGKSISHPAPVVIVALEGVSVLAKKIKSWKRRHGFTDRIGVYVVRDHVNLLEYAEVANLAQLVQKVGADELIIDTLAQSIIAEEDNEAFQRAAAHAGIIRRQTEARVTLLHHSGKDRNRGARGGSALTAAADTVVSIDEHGGRHIIRCDKQRDGEKFAPFYLRLVPDPEAATAYFQKCDGPRVSLVPAGDDELDAAILGYIREHPGTPKAAIPAGIHKQKSVVLARLKALRDAGRIRVIEGGRTGQAELCEVCASGSS